MIMSICNSATRNHFNGDFTITKQIHLKQIVANHIVRGRGLTIVIPAAKIGRIQ